MTQGSLADPELSGMSRDTCPGSVARRHGGIAARKDAGSDELQALDDGDVGLAAAFAHGLEAVTPAGALELVEQRGHEAGTSGTERVTEGDGAAVHVDLAEV